MKLFVWEAQWRDNNNSSSRNNNDNNIAEQKAQVIEYGLRLKGQEKK